MPDWCGIEDSSVIPDRVWYVEENFLLVGFLYVSLKCSLISLAVSLSLLNVLCHRLSREEKDKEWKPLRKADCRTLNSGPGTSLFMKDFNCLTFSYRFLVLYVCFV